MSSFLAAHGGIVAVIVMGFSIVSIILNAVADVFHKLGKQVPGWIGSVSSMIGKVIDFLNGTPAKDQPAAPSA